MACQRFKAAAPVQQELRLLLLARDGADRVLVQARGQAVGLDVGDKAMLVGTGKRLLQSGRLLYRLGIRRAQVDGF